MVTIEQLRKQLKQIDANIIENLAQRQGVSTKIGQLKQEIGKEIIDLTQEKILFEFHENLAEKYQLQQEFIKRLFRVVIAYSRMVQQP